jgi:serine/threonine-protein phosphatase 2A activator
MLTRRYLLGSAQLLGEHEEQSRLSEVRSDLLDSDITPQQSLQKALAPDSSPSSITDFYTLSLHRITMFKKGAAFSEHSPMLYGLSQMPSWQKPHGGLRKMFIGEVVEKRVVVQGLWIGGWCWGPGLPGVPRVRKPWADIEPPSTGSQSITKAPWAR